MFTFLTWLARKLIKTYYVLHNVITLLNEPINFFQNGEYWTICLPPGGVVDRTLVGRGGVVDRTLVGRGGVVDRTLVGRGGVVDRTLVGHGSVVDRTLVGRGGVVDRTIVGRGGVVDRTLVGRGGVVDRTSDSQAREPRLNPLVAVLKLEHLFD